MASVGSTEGLPYELLQKILSSLTLKQKAIASLVSTKWLHIIAAFGDRKIVQTHNCTTRYCGLCNISSNLPNRGDCFQHHRVIKLAADNSFTEFYLFVRGSMYYMTMDVMQSRLLTILHLKGCCKFYEDTFGDIKELSSLKEIYFDHVCISPTYFSKLISKCPSIVEITLIDCYDLYSITVPHLNELRKVHVNGNIVAIDIQARNLQEFHLFSSSSEALILGLCACTKLQVLKIDSEYIPIGFPIDTSSAFPHLKSLFLHMCRRLNQIILFSPEMENLTLSNCVDLDDAFICTPNLCSFKHTDARKLPSLFSMVGSRLVKVEIGLKYVHATNRLPDLRTFAAQFGVDFTFSLVTDGTESTKEQFHLGSLGSNFLPLHIKQINLEILFSWAPRYVSLVDELFSYFHPVTLRVKLSSEALKWKRGSNFIQVLFDELKRPEKGPPPVL